MSCKSQKTRRDRGKGTRFGDKGQGEGEKGKSRSLSPLPFSLLLLPQPTEINSNTSTSSKIKLNEASLSRLPENVRVPKYDRHQITNGGEGSDRVHH